MKEIEILGKNSTTSEIPDGIKIRVSKKSEVIWQYLAESEEIRSNLKESDIILQILMESVRISRNLT